MSHVVTGKSSASMYSCTRGRSRFHLLEIGTGDLGAGQIALYERCGFVRCGVDVDYFRKHYPVPFFANGVECRHMVRLRMELK